MTHREWRRFLIEVTAVAGILVAVNGVSSAGVYYTIQDIGPTGMTSYGEQVSDAGKVAMEARGSGNFHGFIWDAASGAHQLVVPGDAISTATSLNAVGQVAGDFLTPSGREHAALWSSGVMNDLGTLGGDRSTAYSINDKGHVTGSARTSSGAYHAFFYDGTQTLDTALLPGRSNSYGYGINESDHIAGYATNYEIEGTSSDIDDRAFLFRNSTMTDLGTLGGDMAVARALNDHDQVVGWSALSDGSYHAFIWDDTNAMRDLGTLGSATSFAASINNKGQVVGWAKTSGGEDHAFLYEGGNMIDLNDLLPSNSAWSYLDRARGINASGQIVGDGWIAGQRHAYLMTPVPEPATLSLLALGGVVAMWRRKRQAA